MENLKKYGNMLAKLNNEILEDIKSKTDAELMEIGNEVRYTTLSNSSWWEYKISKTVLEHVIYEKRLRQKNKIIKRINGMKQDKKIFGLL